MKFFINSNTTSYLRGLQQEFGESSNAIRIELNRLEEAGMLRSETVGNKKMFRANDQHPLFSEIHNILLKQIGIDRVVEQVIERLGNVERVYLIGDFSKGIDSTIIDLLIIGSIDRSYMMSLVEKAEKVVNRKIRYLLYEAEEFSEPMLDRFTPAPLMLYFNKKETS